MRRIVLSSGVLSLSVLAMATFTGCVGDDTEVPVADSGAASPHPDAGLDATVVGDDAGNVDAALPSEAAVTDSATDGSDAASAARYLTLSYEFAGYSRSEYAAFNLGTARADGHLQYASFGANMSTARSPWVLEQKNDLVMKLDPGRPWVPTASWSVASPPPDAGGFAYADSMSVAETATHAYVALYNRNSVAVLDTTASPDGGAPASRIDLSALVQAGDEDHSVEDSAALYDSATKRVWLVLQNVDEEAPYGGPPDYDSQCVAGLKSTVVAIDTTTNTLVPNLTYTLTGINPSTAILDAANHRLILLDVGCEEIADGGDAAAGFVTGRVVESINLGTGTSTVLLDANAMRRPSGLAYANEHLAFVSFGGATYAWDPTTTSLGSALTNTPDTFVWDGTGLVGPRTSYLGDGGVAIDIITVDPLTGAATTIGSNPMSSPDSSGFFESVDLWPRP